MTLTRKTPMARGKGLARSAGIGSARKPLAKSNPRQQAKRRKSYAKKLAAYKRSETYKIVEARAAGRCEFAGNVASLPMSVIAKYACFDGYGRCVSGEELQHHHKSYARFGGKELSSDVIVLCKAHHEYAESQHPTRNRNYSNRKGS